MSEKVKLTREQAEAIEKYKERQREEHEIQVRSNCVRLREWTRPLITLETDDFINALYIGYEVEETFKVGDWILINKNNEYIMREYHSASHMDGHHFYRNLDNNPRPFLEKNYVRHATPEEIAKEKQRRWWAKHGREVWELRRNDLVSDKDGCSYTINLIKKDYVEFVEFGMRKRTKEVKESFKVICFAEDRKDVDHA